MRADELAAEETRSRTNKLKQLETEARRRHVDVTRNIAQIDEELSAMQAPGVAGVTPRPVGP